MDEIKAFQLRQLSELLESDTISETGIKSAIKNYKIMNPNVSDLEIYKTYIEKNHKYRITPPNEKDGRWSTHVTFPDGTRKRIVKTDELDFYKALFEALTISKPVKKGGPKIKDLYPKWAEDQVKSTTWKVSTKERVDKDWRRIYLHDPIINIPVKDLTGKDISKWVKRVGKGRTRTDFYNIWSILKGVLDFAVDDEELIPENPCIRMPVSLDSLLDKLCVQPKKKAPEKECYFPDEEEMLKALAKEDFLTQPKGRVYKLSAMGILFMFETGMRVGEMCGLMSEDITRKGQAHVQRTTKFRTREILPTPKTEASDRFVTLSSEALAILRQVREFKLKNGYPLDGYIFSIDDKPINSDAVNDLLRSYCNKLNIPYRPSHKIRKTFVTDYINNGTDAGLVASWVGHKDVAVTQKIYKQCNWSIEQERALLDAKKTRTNRLVAI